MKVLSMLVLGLMIFSCVRNKNFKEATNEPQTQMQTEMDMGGAPAISSHVVKVEEVIQGSTYTYLQVSENGQDIWIAVNKMEVEPGETCYYEKALKMENFTSKELARTFDVIYFVSQLSKDPLMTSSQPSMQGHMGKAPASANQEIKLDKKEGELTIAELFENKEAYAGKNIKIKGVLIKINKNIMGRNWLHIQDGTSYSGNYDLTVTSQDVATVGETITLEGVVVLNKDFGAGYAYDMIIEEAAFPQKEM